MRHLLSIVSYLHYTITECFFFNKVLPGDLE